MGVPYQHQGHIQLKIIFALVNSLLSKKDQISLLLTDLNIDILCLNETKLDSTICDSQLLINGYTFIRRDRTRHGGGLGIYVRNSLKHRIVNDLLSNEVEVLWLEISLPKSEPF